MNKRYITAAVCIALCWQIQSSLLKAQTSSMNYIKSIELMAGVTTPEGVNSLPEDLKRTSITYFDGLGRPIQEVTIAKSPGMNDLVQHIEYDGFGRTPLQYLPYTAASQGGGYHANAINSLQQFYSGSVPGIPQTGVYYAQTDYEPSPLNRVLRTASPGEAWALDNGHAVGYDYGTNVPYEVIRFGVQGNDITSSSHYDASTLFKNTVTDEDGQTSITYTDLEGRVVMKRAVLGSNDFADTYYVYNELGLLVCVMMPEANKTTGTFTDWKNAFQYKYDARKRLVRKQIPGADSICYVYNKADLLVAEQDGNMRKQQTWKFYKYDGLQRVILEGFLYSNTSNRVQMQQTADTYSTTLFEIKQVGYFDYFLGYSNNAFPYITGGSNIKQAYYYDDYLFEGDNLNSIYGVYFQPDGFSDAATLMTKGRLTGKIDKSTNTTEVFYYDEYGRMVQRAMSYFSGVFYEGNKFSFNGQLLQSNKRFKYNSNLTAYNYSFSYFYDHDWRPTYTELKAGGVIQRLNTMQYNELSQLETNYLHGDATNALQQQSYAYNIRGWLTGINNIFQGSSGVFAQKLYYNTVPQGASSQATARYNGNISASEWRVDGITPTDFSSGYAFSYDPLNRLTKAAYYKRNTSTTMIAWEGTASNKGSWGAITGIGSEKDITYDKNGNIRTLSRHGRRDSDTDIVLFDNLSYSYEGNRLKSVYDAVAGQNSLGDFPGDGSGIAATFRYDANGNMSGDPVRGLKLSYNQLNMPTIIQHTKGRIENTYAWDGSKRRRVVLDYNNNTLSDECYYGDLVVENGQPTRILHGEGYVDINRMPVFNYHLKDHLGNVRAVISSSYGTGAYTQTQSNDYYPFGMALTMEFAAKAAGEAFTEIGKALPTKDIIDDSKTFTRSNAYLYNGKEEQPMPGKWLDYGARFYDAQLGRWHSVDPAAALYYPFSPYQYGGNSPVNTIDIGGKLFVYVNGFMYPHWRAGNQPERTFASQGTIQNPLYSEYAPDRNFYSDGPRNAGKLFENDYWHGIPTELSQKFRDENILFTNGSFTPGSSGSERFGEGYKNASRLIKKLENGDIKLSEGETIKIMGHSQGAAYAAGLATALLEHPVYKHLVEFVVYLAPDQPNQFKHPEGVPGYQFSTQSDWVSSTGPLAGLRNSEYQKIDGAIWAQQRKSYFDSRGGHGVDSWVLRIITWASSYGIPVTVYE